MRGVSSPLRSPAVAVACARRASRDMSATADAWTKKDLRHTSAVVLVPPRDLWAPIQAIRATNEGELLEAAALVYGLFEAIQRQQQQRADWPGQRRALYVQTGRLLRMITAVQGLLLQANLHNRWCPNCKALRQNCA